MKMFSLALLGFSLAACGGKTDASSDTGDAVVDADNDGFDADNDCDDSNADINPDADEVCDGVDNNCDELVDDETATDAGLWFADADADSYGDANTSMNACEMPEGYVADNTDCDDSDAELNPATLWYADADSDGYGDAGNSSESCEQPSGFVADSSDCNDDDDSINPDGVEVCDGLDNDCDSSTSEDGMATHIDADGVASDVTADVSGTMASPAAFTLSEGDLHFCDGTFYTHLTVDGDAAIASLNQDPTAAILDGGEKGRPVTVMGEGISVSISDVMVTGGTGAEGDIWIMSEGTAGGGIGCLGYETSQTVETDLSLENVIVSGNTAETTGGVFTLGCNLTIVNSEISGNTGTFGGALITFDGTHSLTGVDVTGNSAEAYAGGGFATLTAEASTVTLEDTIYTGNENTGVDGENGGGILAIVDRTSATWTGTAGAQGSGIWGNIAPEYGAIQIIGEGELVADTVDFGVADDGTGNTDIDITFDYAPEYWVGYDDASFSCSDEACGEAVETEIADPTNAQIIDFNEPFGAPFTVDSTGTLNEMSLYTRASANGCMMKFSLLSTTDVSLGTWDVEWTNTVSLARKPSWVSSGALGEVLDDSLTYAWIWNVTNPQQCSYDLSYEIDYYSYYYGGTGTTITGLGEHSVGYLWLCTEGDEGDSVTCDNDLVPVAFAQTYSVTEL